jgi:cytochrome c oxidase subunit IV
MSGHDEHKNFNANKIFLWLFIFTAVEVAWGVLGHKMHVGKPLLWGGLLAFAAFKGVLILQYFMHFRFEGWIVKGLILPTPFLMVVILTVLSPDIACNHKLNHNIGSSYDPQAGEIVELPEVALRKGITPHNAPAGSSAHAPTNGGAQH